MSVRAKFVVQQVTEFSTSDPEGQVQVKLFPVTRTDGEVEDFWKYTPTGTLEMTITNRSAADQFKAGKAFYVDFTEA